MVCEGQTRICCEKVVCFWRSCGTSVWTSCRGSQTHLFWSLDSCPKISTTAQLHLSDSYRPHDDGSQRYFVPQAKRDLENLLQLRPDALRKIRERLSEDELPGWIPTAAGLPDVDSDVDIDNVNTRLALEV